MISQASDIQYGLEREARNHPVLEKFLGVKLRKLSQYNVMDWVEEREEGDESPPWYVEQKARKMTYKFLLENYTSPKLRYPSALIGKNKIDHMKLNGNGMVIFDFEDCMMYWQFNEEEYEKMEIEKKFIRGSRIGYVDKEHPVVHIPCRFLKRVIQ